MTERAMAIDTHSPEETQELGRLLGILSREGDVFLLMGGLGVGKTCLAQGIAWGLGISEYVRSPTFVLMNEYRGRLPFYHIDLYRLEGFEEVLGLGLDEYLFGKGICVVEWAEKAPDTMPVEHLRVVLTRLSDESRCVSLEPHGPRYVALLAQLPEHLVLRGA